MTTTTDTSQTSDSTTTDTTTSPLPSGLVPAAIRTWAVTGATTTTDTTESCCGSCAVKPVRGMMTATGFVPELPPKASAAILDYTIDFTNALAGTGDTLSNDGISVTVTTATGSTSDLSTQWAAVYNGTQAVCMLAAGPAGTMQIATVQVRTTQGRTCTQQIIIPISRETVNYNAATNSPASS